MDEQQQDPPAFLPSITSFRYYRQLARQADPIDWTSEDRQMTHSNSMYSVFRTHQLALEDWHDARMVWHHIQFQRKLPYDQWIIMVQQAPLFRAYWRVFTQFGSDGEVQGHYITNKTAHDLVARQALRNQRA